MKEHGVRDIIAWVQIPGLHLAALLWANCLIPMIRKQWAVEISVVY